MLVGQGVSVSNVRFNGYTGVINSNAIGTFSNGDTCNLGINEGIVLTTGKLSDVGIINNLRYQLSDSPTPSSTIIDPDLAAIDTTVSINDCAVLEFDFIPQTDSVGFRYVFASEEYPNFVCCTFNDRFAFFLSRVTAAGTYDSTRNIALLPGNLPVTINNVNNGIPGNFCDDYAPNCVTTNTAYYTNNYFNNRPIPFNGYTTVLTASARVVPCVTYHLKICIADVNDTANDSGVFLEAGSLSAKSIEVSFRNPDSSETNSHDVLETCCLDMIVKLLNPNSTRRTLQLYRTHSSGVFNASINDYTISPNVSSTNPGTPSTVTFPEGVDSIVFHLCGTADALSEAIEHFRLAYRLEGDCDYLMDTFNIINIYPINITSPLPDNSSGSTVNLYAFSSGGVGPFTYTWIDELTGDTTYTYGNGSSSTITVPLSPLRQYTICITDACGNTECTTTAVGPTPIFIDTSAYYDTVCYNTSTTLTCSGATSYRWYQGTNTTGNPSSTQASYTTPNITSNRVFTVVASRDTLGATWTNTRRYYIAAEPLPSVSITHLERDVTNTTTYACNGDSVHLMGSSNSDVFYRWNNTGEFTSDNTFAFIPNPASTTNTYATTTVTLTVRTNNSRHCQNNRNIAIRTYKHPTLTPANDMEVCIGGSITLRANPQSATGVKYWRSGAPNQVSQGVWSNLAPTVSTDYIIYAATGGNYITCQSTDTVHVTVWPLPVVTASADPVVSCSGEQVTLSGQGASTYTWKQGSSTIANGAVTTVNNTNTNASTATSVTYQLQGTDNHGCTNTSNVTVQVHSIPSVTLTATPNPICQGGNVTLTATGPRNISWDSTTWNYSTPFTHTQQLNTLGTNTLYAWGYNTLQRCNRRSQTSVNVLAFPTVHVTADADSVCAGSSTTLHLSGAYEYSLNDTLHFTTSATRIVTPTGTGTTYTIYGRTASHICISSTTIRIGVLPLPTVTLSATDTNLCQGQSAILTATGGISYNWQAGSTVLSSHDASVTVTPTATTVYTVEGVTAGSTPCSTTRTIQVNVFNYPILTAMADTGICAGSSMLLRANPRTATGTSYWYTLMGGNGSALGFGSQAHWTVTPADTCDYIVHASRGPNEMCQRADTVHVTVWPLPEVTASANPMASCSGENVTLNGGGATNYVWKRGSTSIASSQTTTVTNTNTNANSVSSVSYQVQGIDGHGCMNSANVTVQVHSIPSVSLTANPNPICEGGSVTLTATGPKFISWDSTTWSNTTPFSHTVQLDSLGSNTLYVWGYNTLARCNRRSQTPVTVLAYPTVHVTADADSVCAGTSTTLHLSGAYEYSINDTLHFSTSSSRVVTPTGTGTTYTIYGRTASHICVSSATIRIGVLPLPTVTLTAIDTVLCNGQSTLLTATGGVSYNWYAGSTALSSHDSSIAITPTATTVYTVEGVTTGYSPCSTARTITIEVFNWPTFTAMADTGVCATDGLSLRANPSSATGVTYWYTLLGGNGSALGMGSLARWNVIPTDTCDYIIHASRGPNHLCHLTDTVHVDRFPLPLLITQAVPPVICSGDTAVLTAQGASQYTWNYNNSPLPNQQGGTARVTPTNDYVDSMTVTYSLQATDSNQCHNTATQTVTVHSVPTISLQLPQTEFCIDDDLLRTATGARYYSWDSLTWVGPYTDAYISTLPLPSIGYDTLHLWGSNSRYACNDYLERTIQVFNYPALQVTPSADTICWGDNVTLSLSGAHQYSVNGDTYDTATQRTYTLTNTTTFIIHGRLANGLCDVADTVTIHVLPLPLIEITPSAYVICQGDTVTLSASNTGMGGASGFRWYRQGESSPLVSDSNAIQHFTPDTTTTYRVTGITEGNVRCQNNGMITVTVFQRPVLSVMADTALCHHQTLRLHASATSTTPPVRYTYRDRGNTGVETRNSVNSQVSWNIVSNTVDTMHYILSASTGPDSLCRIYDTVQVIVRPLPDVVLTPNRYEFCDGDTLVLTGTGAVTYAWGTPSAFNADSIQSSIPSIGAHSYTLYGEDPYGCRNSDTTAITVYGYPNTQLASNIYDICHGSTIALTASGAQHYSWDGGNTWRNAQPATGVDTLTRILYDSITIYVEGYNLSPLCQVRDSVRIRVYSYPVMTWVADTNQICLNDTVHLTATGAVEYSFDNGTTWGTTNAISYVPSTPTTHSYRVIGRSEGPGCQTPLDLNVQVHPLPNLQLNVSNSAFCIDTVVYISATGGERYRFYDDTTTVLPFYDTVSHWSRQPDSSTTFFVDCLTQHNCFATIQHTVEVWTGRFQLFCEDTIVCEHGHVAVSAQGMELYYWNENPVPDSHNVFIFTVDTSRDFTVEGFDSHGCHGAETLHVDVYPNPHLQLSADTLGTCVGGTVTIHATGAGEYIYHWDSPTPTFDSSHTALVTDTTWYTVTGIEGNLRCQSVDSIMVVAYPLPPVSLTGHQRDICDRDTLVLTATGADRYSWGDTLAFNLSPYHYDVPATDSVYLVWGEEDTYHCRNYDTTAVHWFGHPAVSLVADRTRICQGDSAVLTFGGAPFFDWNNSGTLNTATSVVVHPDSTTLYHLHSDLRNPRFCGSDTTLLVEVFPIPEVQVAASDTQLCYGDTVTLFASGATYYAWLDDTSHLSADTLRLPLYHSSTLYLSGTISNRLCYNNDSIHVTVYDPRVRLNPQAWEICNGGSLIISATGSDRYRWTDDGTFTDSASHTFVFTGNGTTSSQSFIHVTGETANHLCQADTTISIVVYPGPHIRMTIEDVDSIATRTWEVCAGDSVTFFASGGYFYQFPGQTTATRPVRHLYHPQPTGPDTSVYVLYGENFNHQCSGYDSLTIIVNPLPDVSLDASHLLTCEGDSVLLSASGATQYSWFGPGNYGNDTSRTVAVDSTTQFLLWGRDQKLCRNYDTLTVTAFPFPQVHLSASADTICQGFSTTITATGATAYAWTNALPDSTQFSTLNTQLITPLHDTIVYVWGNNFNGLCATLDSIRITVLPVPSVQIVADRNAICWGDTAHLSALCSENTWSWDNGPYGSLGLTVTPTDSTWYHIATRAANGCYAYDSLLVEVRPFYHVRLHGDTNVCSGDSLWLSATGSDLYAWGDESTFSPQSGRFVSPLHDTLVIVHGTPRDSICRAADTIPIHVHQRPNLYVDPETTTVCLGDSIVLSASGCEQYRWMDETDFGLHNGYHVYRPQQSMTYIVTGSMPGGVCVVTAPIEMIVIDTPQVQFYGPTDICLGDSVRLTASGGERYAWENGNYSTSGYFHAHPDTLGTFTYHVASRVHTLNCTGRASITVNVHPVPVLTLTADDSVLCYGDGTTITADGSYQYSWNMGVSYTPVSQQQVSPPQTTLYTVYATDSIMLCADTQSITIVVNPLPNITLSPDTTEFCLGGSLTLTASGGNAYAWRDPTPFSNIATQTLTPLHDTIVDIWGIDSNGCINHDNIYISLHNPFQPYQHDAHHVVVHNYPSVSATIDHAQICLGDNVTLTASGAQQYRWLDMGNFTTNPLTDTPIQTRTYTVEGQMTYGCPDTATVSVEVFNYPRVRLRASDTLLCEGDTLRLFASGAPRYSWPGSAAFGTDSIYTVVPPVGRHTLHVDGATGNLLCDASDTVHVTVYPYPDMTLYGAHRWCEGSEVTITVGNPADTLWWTSTPVDATLSGQEHADTLHLHPVASTLYHLRGKSHICAVEMDFPVEIVPYPNLSLNTSADRICIGDTVLLTASGGELYSWLGLPNGAGTYTTNDSLRYRPQTTGFFPILATTYDTLCSVTDSLFIFVDTVPVMSITGSDSGCIGRTVTLEAHSEVPIFWNSEPYDPALDTQASMFTIVVSPTSDIRYFITGNSGLCQGAAEHQVTTGIIPRAKGVATPNRVRRGEADIELRNLSTHAEGFYWLFPDSTVRYGDHYQYQIPPSWMPDTFLIQLVAYLGGCADTASIPVTLFVDEVWVANVFTPNEETNNRFFIPTLNKENFHVEIYNRRGLLVYESDDPDEGWDGRSKGELCPQATYVYRFRTSPKGSKEVKYQYGTVTLLR